MTEDQIIPFIDRAVNRRFENDDIEYKTAKKEAPQHFYDTLSSFSNTRGGVIIFGINEKEGYSVEGVDNPSHIQKAIENACGEMEPRVHPLIHLADYQDKKLVLAEIPLLEKILRPCYYKPFGIHGGSFVRDGEADVHMSDYMIYSLSSTQLQTQAEYRTFPNLISEDLIDKTAEDLFLQSVLNANPNLQNLPKKDLLLNRGLRREDLPTLTDILLFGKAPQMASAQYVIECNIPSGDSYGINDALGKRFDATERCEGRLSDQLRQALGFIQRNMATAIAFKEDGSRINLPDYPLIAVREAILNALVHRDYSSYKALQPITLSLWKDRLTITSPGLLFGNMTIENLGHVRPDVRNASLASNLQYLSTEENQGSGIPTMRAELAKLDKLPPFFEEIGNDFRVTFFKATRQELAAKGKIKPEDILDYCRLPRSFSSLAQHFAFNESRPYYFFDSFVEPLIKKGLLELTLPDKKKSVNQRVVIADKGQLL
jgi:ATP-dependent DNA helicase RecG